MYAVLPFEWCEIVTYAYLETLPPVIVPEFHLAHLSENIKRQILGLTTFGYDLKRCGEVLRNVPARFHSAIVSRYAKQYERIGQRQANMAMLDLQESFCEGRLSLAASDQEIIAESKTRAKAVSVMLSDVVLSAAQYVREKLARYAAACGVVAPQCDRLIGIVSRMIDAAWWRRALRKGIARSVEKNAIALGLVSKRASIYASAEAVERRAEQKKRNAKILENTEAQNEIGQVFTLAEMSARNVSNPAIRRAELMTRIAGFEQFAKDAGHVGMFYTITCPSRMHARHAATGEENAKYDGTTPRQAQQYLCALWAKARAWLHRRGIALYGFRVAEPHHDGTPHWHILVFVPGDAVAGVTAGLQKYAGESDAAELSTDAARRARFCAVTIDPDKGSAAGYIAKYIAKNIDGFAVGDDLEKEGTPATETALNVDAWASTWGIRQFQPIGGPSVSVWRELRRLRASPQMELFDRFWTAADAGNWNDFTVAMGGAICPRRLRPVATWQEWTERKNRYEEPIEYITAGVRHCNKRTPLRTRLHVWTIRAKLRPRENIGIFKGRGGASPVPGVQLTSDERRRILSECAAVFERDRVSVLGVGSVFDVPWTRVNNCTQESKP